MIRRALAIAFVFVSTPVVLHAQDTVLTVTVASADVYQGPSNVTPVIGHVARGTAMPVLRNLGSWVRISWPAAPDGVGYVHVTMGRLSAPSDQTPAPRTAPQASSAAAAASASSSPAAAASANAQAPSAPRPRTAPRERVAIRSQGDTTAISHVMGFGAVIGSMRSFGATARAWRDNRLGLQVAFTRDAMTSDVNADRVTALQLEPAVVYGLFDSVSDYFWIRPYVGSGVSIRHQTLHQSAVGTEPPADNGVGFRVFGGSEMTFAGVPRVALSVEVGYRRLPTPFAGFPADRFAASIAGHWYIK